MSLGGCTFPTGRPTLLSPHPTTWPPWSPRRRWSWSSPPPTRRGSTTSPCVSALTLTSEWTYWKTSNSTFRKLGRLPRSTNNGISRYVFTQNADSWIWVLQPLSSHLREPSNLNINLIHYILQDDEEDDENKKDDSEESEYAEDSEFEEDSD